MAGTIQGGKLAAEKIRQRDPDHWRRIGAIGGKNGTTGGFATMDSELHRLVSSKGGRISRRNRAPIDRSPLSSDDTRILEHQG